MLRVLTMVSGAALAVVSGLATADAADNTSGAGALALAVLVGLRSPVGRDEKAVLTRLLDGRRPVPARGRITIAAKAVTCRSSDVDITAHACTLVFGTRSVAFKGRPAHELYATLIENGVPSDGAAGSIYEAVSDLVCTIDPAAVNQADGGGAACRYTAGPGS